MLLIHHTHMRLTHAHTHNKQTHTHTDTDTHTSMVSIYGADLSLKYEIQIFFFNLLASSLFLHIYSILFNDQPNKSYSYAAHKIIISRPNHKSVSIQSHSLPHCHFFSPSPPSSRFPSLHFSPFLSQSLPFSLVPPSLSLHLSISISPHQRPCVCWNKHTYELRVRCLNKWFRSFFQCRFIFFHHKMKFETSTFCCYSATHSEQFV